MKIEKNDMVMVYDGGGTVPHCKYTGRFGDLTACWQEIVSDAVYLFRLGESEECDWLVLLQMEPIGFFAEVAERPTRAIREQRSRCAWAVCARSEEEKTVRRWFVSKRERYMKPSEMLEYKSGNIHPRYPTP